MPIAYPVVHGPGSVILEYVVDCSQLLELLLCLWVLVRVDHHCLLLVFPLDLLGRGIDADVHQLVEGSIDRVNLSSYDQDVFKASEVILG